MKTRIKPNAEQSAIIEAFLSHNASIAINALAGTGKTTTLRLLGEAAPKRKAHYLAFNRAIADDAKASMPKNVAVSTMHALAYKQMQPDRARLEARLSGTFVAQQFNLPSLSIKTDIGPFSITPARIGLAAIATVNRYCNSADDFIQPRHVPSWSAVFENAPSFLDGDAELKNLVFRTAEKIWEKMSTGSGDFPITHDTYLKHWALTGGKISADVVFFDEAQDASGVFLQILDNQIKSGRRVVCVGDKNQQIYAWRGAVDALNKISGDRFYLTRSYRFGSNVAEIANRMLRCLGESNLLIGEGSGKGVDGSKAILARTNAKAISLFFNNPDANLVGAKELLSTVTALDTLINGGVGTGPFSLFTTYQSLIEYANTPDGADLRPLIKLNETLGTDELIARLEKAIHSKHKAGALTISTVHKAKGREWDYVTIANDWRPPKTEARADEMRLMYVALTRGRCGVDAGEVLDWIAMCEQRTQAQNGGETPADAGTDPAVGAHQRVDFAGDTRAKIEADLDNFIIFGPDDPEAAKLAQQLIEAAKTRAKAGM